MSDLKNEIHDYWTNRARGYSEYNQQEMADARQTMWRAKLLDLLRKQFPEREPKEIKILDVGTGPGFFAILLAEAGYQVTAIDYTEEMLKEAQQNAGGLAECIVWKTGDAQALDVENNSFDAIVTRNVTWNLPRPDLINLAAKRTGAVVKNSLVAKGYAIRSIPVPIRNPVTRSGRFFLVFIYFARFLRMVIE